MCEPREKAPTADRSTPRPGFSGGVVPRALAFLAALALAPLPAGADPAEKHAREGVEFFKKGELDAALDRFGRAAELRPDLPGIQYNLGTTLARREKFSEAAEKLAAAVAASGSEGAEDPKGAARARKDPATARATRDALFNLGYAQARAADSIPPEKLDERIAALKSALESFRQAIVADPSDAEAKYNYETLKREIRKLEEQKKSQEQQQQGGKSDQDQDGEKQDGEQKEGESRSDESNQDGEKQDGERQDSGEESKPEEKPGEEKEPQDSGPQDSKPEDSKQGDSQSQADQGDRSKEDPKQGEGKEKRQDGMEATPTPAPATPQPPPGAQSGQPGEPQPTPLTPEQLDALRVLNGLSEARPEQFQKLFRFRGKKGEPLAKPW